MIGTDIAYACALLQEGALVAIPTETVYGLAANALDSNAVLKIFSAKNRPTFNPLIVHVADLAMAQSVAHFDRTALDMADLFWPGPLTLILPKKELVPDIVTSGLNTVGVRIPQHPSTLALIKALGKPLAAPSANPFGYVSPTSAEHVLAQMESKVAYILDGGKSNVGLESTIVQIVANGLHILRLGGLSLATLTAKSGLKIASTQLSTSKPSAPGQLIQHYSPGKPLYQYHSLATLMAQLAPNDFVITFGQHNLNHPFTYNLSEKADTFEAAQHLFVALRTADKKAVKRIWAPYLPDEGLGNAINDRLLRAAATL